MTPPKGPSGSANCGCNKKTRLFGPGTLVALAIAALVLVVGFANSTPGKRVASKLPTPTRPLWKPEPASLLPIPALRLSPDQKRQIERIDQRWQTERQGLLSAMAPFHPKAGNESQIRDGLQDYSELSRRYDIVRASCWAAATALLTPDQRSKLRRGAK